jgi:hypothetical protein
MTSITEQNNALIPFTIDRSMGRLLGYTAHSPIPWNARAKNTIPTNHTTCLLGTNRPTYLQQMSTLSSKACTFVNTSTRNLLHDGPSMNVIWHETHNIHTNNDNELDHHILSQNDTNMTATTSYCMPSDAQ